MKTNLSKIFFLAVILGIGFCQTTRAQYKNTTAQEDPAYAKAIQERVAKIVAPLALKDAAKQKKVQRVVEQQYFDLNRLFAERDAQTAALKDKGLSEAIEKDSVTAIKARSDARVATLHPQYIGRLNKLLKKDQVTEIKDGMTYHVLDVTYGAYTDMLPDLSKKQKKQIMAWLVEAREHAIDGGTSKEKHAWFGKYKGKVNNYLSDAGVNMKEAEIAWKKRRDARK